MRTLIILLSVVVFTSGCMKLRQMAHLRPLLTLKAVSDNGEVKKQHITEDDARFERLLEAVKDGTLQQYSFQSDLLKQYGPPIYENAAVKDGKVITEWMYRYSTKFSNSEKVYLYFDDAGQFVSWKHIQPKQMEVEHGEIFQETQAEAGFQKI